MFGQLKKIEKQYECIEVVRGKGLLLGMELFPQYAFLQAQLIEQAFKNCLLLYPSVGGINGTDENGILIAPPFIISREEIDELIQKLILSLDQVITNNM